MQTVHGYQTRALPIWRLTFLDQAIWYIGIKSWTALLTATRNIKKGVFSSGKTIEIGHHIIFPSSIVRETNIMFNKATIIFFYVHHTLVNKQCRNSLTPKTLKLSLQLSLVGRPHLSYSFLLKPKNFYTVLLRTPQHFSSLRQVTMNMCKAHKR